MPRGRESRKSSLVSRRDWRGLVVRESVSFGRRASAFVVAVLALLTLLPNKNAFAANLFSRGPFIQSLGQTGVTVKVELFTPEPVIVEVIGPDGTAKTTQAADPRRFQALRVDGLSPDTNYRYRVLAGATKEPSEEGRFTTAPATPKPFKFIVYGDSRSDPAAHVAVVRAIEATPSDFLLHTGDMVAMGDEEDDWKGFFEAENKLLRDRCVFASVGNHELAGEAGVGAAAFLRYFASADEGGKDRPKLYGTFRWANARFFLLNAMDQWTGEERTWLKEELDRAANEEGLTLRVAALHHGPFSSGPHGGNKRLHDGGILQIFREGKVDLVLAGHDHAYERGAGEGIKYVVSGGAGAPLYPRKTKAQETAVYESVHHFVELSVRGTTVDLVAKRASGSVIEKCSFANGSAWSCEGSSAVGGVTEPKANIPAAAPPTGSACLCGLPGDVRSLTSSQLEALGLLSVIVLWLRRVRNRS